MEKKVDFSKTEICKDIFVADEAVEILEKYFLGVSPDLPMIIDGSHVYSLFNIRVSLRSDGKYIFDFKESKVFLEEKNPGCTDYFINLNGEAYGKNSSSI